MIHYQVHYDDALWVPVLESAPERVGEEIIRHYRKTYPDLTDGIMSSLHELAAAALALRTDETGHLLLFSPAVLAPAIGVLGINVLESQQQVDLLAAVTADDTAVLRPSVERITDDYWGRGRRAAVVTRSTIANVQGGRFNYAFQRGSSLLVATAVADRLGYATLMLEHADRLVTSVRMEEDD